MNATISTRRGETKTAIKWQQKEYLLPEPIHLSLNDASLHNLDTKVHIEKALLEAPAVIRSQMKAKLEEVPVFYDPSFKINITTTKRPSGHGAHGV